MTYPLPEPNPAWNGYRTKTDPDVVAALGLISWHAAHLESRLHTLLSVLLGDYEIGERLLADAAFGWMIDHERAVASLVLDDPYRAEALAVLDDARMAYIERNKVIHGHWYVQLDEAMQNSGRGLFRATARGKAFKVHRVLHDAESLNKIGRRLEEVSHRALEMIVRVKQQVGEPRDRRDGGS